MIHFDDFNEIYHVDLMLNENKHLRNRTFDEILCAMRTLNMLLLGIKVVFHDKNHKEIIDKNLIIELLQKQGLERQFIVNPVTSTETNRKTDSDDVLVVLAKCRNELKKNIHLIKFPEEIQSEMLLKSTV